MSNKVVRKETLDKYRHSISGWTAEPEPYSWRKSGVGPIIGGKSEEDKAEDQPATSEKSPAKAWQSQSRSEQAWQNRQAEEKSPAHPGQGHAKPAPRGRSPVSRKPAEACEKPTHNDAKTPSKSSRPDAKTPHKPYAKTPKNPASHPSKSKPKPLSGLIRITSGEFRGRVIKSPASDLVHPMGSRERLSLLNSVSPNLSHANVLDVYAGTGALGLEALSRGTARVTFVERSPAVAKVLKENIRMLGLIHQAKIILSPVEYLLRPLPGRASPLRAHSFNIIIADPPYPEYNPVTLLPLEHYLRAGGVLALSHPKGSPAPEFLNLTLKSFHLHAECRISIFQA